MPQIALCVLAGMIAFASTPANSVENLPARRAGRVLRVWADPSDVVFSLGDAGPCGNVFYHSERSATNFDQAVALLYTSFALSREVEVTVARCKDDGRNVVTVINAGA